MADPNVFRQHLARPKSSLEYAAAMDAADLQAMQMQGERLKIGQAQEQVRRNALERAAYEQAVQAGGSDEDILGRLERSGFMGLAKTAQDARKAKADRAKDQAAADKNAAETRAMRMMQAYQEIEALQTPDQARASIAEAAQTGALPPQVAQAIIGNIPDEPEGFEQWKSQMFAMRVSAEKRAETAAAQQRQQMQDATTRRGQDITSATAQRGQDINASTARRGQDISAATTRRGQDLSASTAIRGQDLTNARASDATNPAKPMPTSALKLQQEDIEAIGTFAGLDSDLASFEQQITDGKLKLGLVSNATGKARNFVGASDENSRNLASFTSKLEGMRNAILLLNKGVQTEGDAQRAMNELMSNINDTGVVKKRLAEIRALNRRAVNLRKMNVDTVRANFGHPPMDFTGVSEQPSSVVTSQPSVDDLLKKYGGGK